MASSSSEADQNPSIPMEAKKLHIAMFPWLAFGHIIPFLDLSKFLASKGHKITFISTPRNIDRLPKISPEFASSITLLKLPLPKIDDGLPPNAEATMDISNDNIPYLKKAYDGLEPDLTNFLENSLPDWIIHDFSSFWLPPIAAKLGISKAFFSIINAWFIVNMGSSETMLKGIDPRTKPEDFTVPPKWVPFETKVAYKLYESHWIIGSTNQNISGVSDTYRTGVSVEGTDAIFIRHCNEFEGQWWKLLEDLHNKPVIPLGLMPPEANNSGENWGSIKGWLDNQKKGSVVYVALGSEVSLNETQIKELALGLELCGIPFLWALRKPENLPDEFEERVEATGKGIVWKKWAPQLKILSHESVGGFLTHCGWSSCIEGLMFGHPLIMLPFVVDQGLNARVLQEREVGVEVARNELDGSYTRDSVADSLRMVMVGNEGKRFKEKAKEVSLVFGDRELHNRYLNEFVKFLEKKRPLIKPVST
ncbi:hypothetical protein M9H77_19597 [Catharanthus roseus]|uniref:Uncharacterized protein n=1 Tax=Catharanthus roseus TaxID=4058 RepID=A0ACC0BAV4_CATRO|nr:hypothetical protein M9H77_19597 [Catharanthus roseus]